MATGHFHGWYSDNFGNGVQRSAASIQRARRSVRQYQDDPVGSVSYSRSFELELPLAIWEQEAALSSSTY